MKPTKKVKADSKGCAEAVVVTPVQKKFVQMAFQFDWPTEEPVKRSRSRAKPVQSPKKPEDPYASVKRVSLVFESSLQGRPVLSSTEAAKTFFQEYWAANPACDQERFVVACLDTKLHVQCVVVITIGTLDASLVHPREVFKPAFIEGSSAIMLSHNHPSGNPQPSTQDRQVTERLTEAGNLIGITVLDHIIHGDGTGLVHSIREG